MEYKTIICKDKVDTEEKIKYYAEKYREPRDYFLDKYRQYWAYFSDKPLWVCSTVRIAIAKNGIYRMYWGPK